MKLQDDIPTRELEETKAKRLHVVRPGQWVWIGCWVVLGVAFAYVGQLLPPLGCLILAYLGYRQFENGPGYLIFGKYVGSHLRRRIGGAILRPKKVPRARRNAAKSAQPGEADKADPAEPVARRSVKPPLRVRILGLPLEHAGYELGTLYDDRNKTDTIRVSGRGWSGASINLSDRYYAENDLMDAVRQAVQLVDVPVGVSEIFSVRPLNLERGNDWALANLHNDVIDVPAERYAQPATADEVFAANHAQLQAIKRERGRDVIATIGLTVPRPDSWLKGKNGDVSGWLSNKQIEDSQLVRMAQLLKEGMERNGVSGAEVLDAYDTHVATKMAWDIAGIAEWYRKIANLASAERLQRLAESEIDVEQSDTAPTEKVLWPWPQYDIFLGPNYLRTDGTYHRVLKIAKQRKKVRPGDLAEQFFTKVGPAHKTGYTIAACGETVSAETELRWLNRGIVIGEGIRRARVGDKDLHESSQKQEQRQRMRRREHTIYLGGSLAFSYNIFIVVSAMSLEELDDAEQAARASCRGVGIRPKTIKLENRQVDAFFTATLGLSMM